MAPPWTATAQIDADANHLVIATRFAVVRRRGLPGVAPGLENHRPQIGPRDKLRATEVTRALPIASPLDTAIVEVSIAKQGSRRARPLRATDRACRL